MGRGLGKQPLTAETLLQSSQSTSQGRKPKFPEIRQFPQLPGLNSGLLKPKLALLSKHTDAPLVESEVLTQVWKL